MFFVSYDDALETVLHGFACAVDQCTFSNLGQFCILTPSSVAMYAVFALWYVERQRDHKANTAYIVDWNLLLDIFHSLRQA